MTRIPIIVATFAIAGAAASSPFIGGGGWWSNPCTSLSEDVNLKQLECDLLEDITEQCEQAWWTWDCDDERTALRTCEDELDELVDDLQACMKGRIGQ